jgi:hypothetical protein
MTLQGPYFIAEISWGINQVLHHKFHILYFGRWETFNKLFFSSILLLLSVNLV